MEFLHARTAAFVEDCPCESFPGVVVLRKCSIVYRNYVRVFAKRNRRRIFCIKHRQ